MNSSNISPPLNGSASYVFVPVNYTIKIAIACANVIAGIYGLTANVFILYFTSKRKVIDGQRTAFRRSLTDCFIKSLALSDILGALIGLPVFTAEMFIDYMQTDLICKIVRYGIIFFLVVTIMNYFVIGIERYLTVYYPFSVPSNRVCKRLVVAAWIVGGLFTMLPMPSYNLVRFDVGNNMYTHVCKYDNTDQSLRGFFLSFTVIVYIVPCIVLTVTSIRVLKFLRRMRRVAPGTNPQITRTNVSTYKTTNMFISLIFAFIIPYIAFMFYSGTFMILKVKISFSQDYISRHLNVMVAYANGAIGATILFYQRPYLRRKLIEMFRSVFCANQN